MEMAQCYENKANYSKVPQLQFSLHFLYVLKLCQLKFCIKCIVYESVKPFDILKPERCNENAKKHI